MSRLVLLTNTDGKLDSLDFTTPPSCTTLPTSASQLANKQYVDNSVGAIDVTNSSFSQPVLQVLLDASNNNKNNTAVGENSFNNYNSLSIGSNNTCLGKNALSTNLSGTNNTAVGVFSLNNNTEGAANTAIGYNSLASAITGNYNTAIGMNSMAGVTNGSQYNVAIGYDSGSGTWGNSSYGITLLGAGTSINGVYTFSTAVGSTAAITKSNQIVLGTANEVVTIPKFTTAGVVHNLANGDLTSSLIFAADISSNAITESKLALDISYNGTFKVKDITGDSVTTQVANKGYVDTKVSDLVGLTTPASLDTLSEIASIIADSSGNRIFALDASMNLKAPLANPTFTGTVDGITATMVGLGNVTNTSDANKPVSTAQQTALDLKAPLANPTFTGTVGGITATMVGLGNVTNTSDANKPVSTAQQTALDLKAPLANPTFTGTVSVSGLNTSGVVHTDVSGNLSTSSIITSDIQDGSITTAKLALDLDLSGNPTATTQSSSDNSTKIATTAYVKNQNYITSSSLGVMPTTAPGSPVLGSFYFDTSGNALYIYGDNGFKSIQLV